MFPCDVWIRNKKQINSQYNILDQPDLPLLDTLSCVLKTRAKQENYLLTNQAEVLSYLKPKYQPKDGVILIITI